jgi:formylglycine-generating enzyme required for sulfatase activity
MRTTAAVLLLLAAAAASPAGEPADPPPPLHFLGLNDRGHEEWFRGTDGAVVVRIPGGTFLRRPYQGADATEEPVPVAVRSFLMDKHEVTNGRFARFLAATAAPAVPGLLHDGKEWIAAPGLEQHPVTAATGRGATAFAAWAGARIPTADEWMKAAGGPGGLLYPWGDAAPDGSRALFGGPPATGPAPVGSRPAGASPYGCLDMAGNVYDRVLAPGRGGAAPVMLKGASWASLHPLNLRVLDLCMQPEEVADRTVGFRCAMDDPEPDRKPRTPEERPVLRLARTFEAAVAEARERRVPLFLSLLHDTCGQCDRTLAGCFRDPRFVRYANEHLVVAFGHVPTDGGDRPHASRPDGSCPVHAGLTCREHEVVYVRGLEVVGSFPTSPGNFLLDPFRAEKGAGRKALLAGDREFPKWGDAVEAYLAAFDRGRAALRDGAPAK